MHARQTPHPPSFAPWMPERTVVIGRSDGAGSAFADTIDRFTSPVLVERLFETTDVHDPDLVVVEDGVPAGHRDFQIKRLRRAFGDAPIVLLVEDSPASVRDCIVEGFDAVVPTHTPAERVCRAFAGTMARATCVRLLDDPPSEPHFDALSDDDEFSEAVAFVEERGEFSLLCYQLFDRPVPGGAAVAG